MAFQEGESLYLQGEDGRRYWFRYEPGMVKLGGMGTVDGSRFKDLEDGDSVEIVGNFCYDTEPTVSAYRKDALIAVRQLGEILGLSAEEMSLLPRIPPNGY